jgi:hypothetical protein
MWQRRVTLRGDGSGSDVISRSKYGEVLYTYVVRLKTRAIVRRLSVVDKHYMLRQGEELLLVGTYTYGMYHDREANGSRFTTYCNMPDIEHE